MGQRSIPLPVLNQSAEQRDAIDAVEFRNASIYRLPDNPSPLRAMGQTYTFAPSKEDLEPIGRGKGLFIQIPTKRHKQAVKDLNRFERPIIAIPGRVVDIIVDGQETTGYSTSRHYVNAVFEAGGIPFICPPTDNLHAIKAIAKYTDGILLQGGEDIDPELYNEIPHAKLQRPSKERDYFEYKLMELALEYRIPVLGICRGHQMIGVTAGARLAQDIIDYNLSEYNHFQNPTNGVPITKKLAHDLILDPKSKIAEILGVTTIPANSYHHQAVEEYGLKGFKTVGWSDAEDGAKHLRIVEVIEREQEEGKDWHFCIGVQCHPEIIHNYIRPWKKLFRAFVDASLTHHREIHQPRANAATK